MTEANGQIRLPEAARELFDAPNFVTVATVDPDGTPQLSIVWAKLEGDDLLFSTVKGRRKHSNLMRDTRASALVSPTGDGYSYAEIRGTATVTDDPEAALINELSVKYTGQPFGARPGEQRVIVRLTAHKVFLYLD